MDYQKKYEKWLNSPYLKEEDKKELRSIAKNKDEIVDRFYKDLDFGTGGIRGKIAIGANRINIYTVGQTTQGLANYLLRKVKKAQEKGVVIAHDPRHMSREFTEQTARVLTANGIKTYLFDDIRPTPELSFAVKMIGAAAGIVITASHNPPDYNGYKVYAENGAQILPEVADEIIYEIGKIRDYSEVKLISLEEAKKKELCKVLGEVFDRVYYEKVKTLALSNDEEIDKEIRIVYTPLHGTGNIPIRTILKDREFKKVFVDEEQAKPDAKFSTVASPNPENPEAFERAVELGKKVGAEILIATDPDCDRIAVAVLNKKNDYVFLNGNQTGALLLDYILKRRQEKGKLPKKGFVIKTIVTSEMGRVISEHYNIPTYDTLTGFKFICNKAEELEKEGRVFLFGYEESIGYLAGNFVRDKDAVISAMLIVEMAAFYKKKGLTLLDVLQGLYAQHGYFLEHLESIFLEGMEGEQKMEKIMASFREEFPRIPGMTISRKIDYKTSFQYDYEHNKKEIVDLPSSDVLKCFFTDGSWYAIRPSGTEPKIKIYMSLVGKGKAEAEEKLAKVKSVVFGKIEDMIK
ncbi:MAG: phospho-sugar mutase [Bacteroidales bacterium]|nr:phospho-sugar mutase [Bacteroidales bacterium]